MSSKSRLSIDIYSSKQTGFSNQTLSISTGVVPGGLSGYQKLKSSGTKGGGIGYSENALGERIVNIRIVSSLIEVDLNYNEATGTLETLQI